MSLLRTSSASHLILEAPEISICSAVSRLWTQNPIWLLKIRASFRCSQIMFLPFRTRNVPAAVVCSIVRVSMLVLIFL